MEEKKIHKEVEIIEENDVDDMDMDDMDMDDMDMDMDMDDMDDIKDVVPKMEINVPQQEECIIKDETLVTLYDEILSNSRSDRTQTEEILLNFINMVMNDGESSSASKEAIVNLMKIKSDISDKMTKIADLMTRIKLKERDTFPKFMASQQNNKIVFDGSKRQFLKRIEKMGKKKSVE
jgi:hypothetical protein